MDDVHAMAVPSLWPEPFGLVGIEAQARGRPAVGMQSAHSRMDGRRGALGAGAKCPRAGGGHRERHRRSYVAIAQ